MKFSALTTFTIAFLLGTATVDSYGQMGQGMMKGRMMERGGGRCFGDRDFMMNTLKLSEKQINDVGQINEKYRGMLFEFKDKLAPKKEGLKKILLTESPDFEKLRFLLKEISDIELEIRLIKIKQSLEIEKIFDPSQREQLRSQRRMNWD